MKYGYMEVAETRSAQLLSPDGLLDYILQFQVILVNATISYEG